MMRSLKVSPLNILLKTLFILFYGVLGIVVTNFVQSQAINYFNWVGVTVGIVLGCLLIVLDYFCARIPARNLLCALAGLFVSLLLSRILRDFLLMMPIPTEYVHFITLFLFITLAYVCTWIMIYSQDDYQLLLPFVRLQGNEKSDRNIILDTSVIIDGRIAEMCNTSFLSGRLIIPRFVLKELQLIADSSDALKRNRGRRGLEILNKIKKTSKLQVKIHETDFPEIPTVDAKLVKLASVINGCVFTNDYNLGKVAELQNIEILNINEIANILKPVVLPGEQMQVKIIKEGKESTQGVAYLDDGTMVVVENGRHLIGKTANVVVTSAYQTQAGRMIFAKSESSNGRGF